MRGDWFAMLLGAVLSVYVFTLLAISHAEKEARQHHQEVMQAIGECRR